MEEMIQKHDKDEKNRLKEYHKNYQAEKKKKFLHCIKMSGNTLNFNEVEINKNRYHGSNQSIELNLVDVHKIVTVSEMPLKHGDKSLKYFIGYADGDIITPLCIKLSQMSGFI